MDNLNSLIEHGFLSLAGLMIYSLIAVKDNLKNFSFDIFWNDNKPFWIWAFSLQLIFASLVSFYPDSISSIKSLSGIDLSEPMAFLTSGASLAGFANYVTGVSSSKQNRIGKKTNVEPSNDDDDNR